MDFNFNKIGEVDVTELKNSITNLNLDSWFEYQDRQLHPTSPLKKTETIPILFTKNIGQVIPIEYDFNTLDNNKFLISKYYYFLNIEDFLKKIQPIYDKSFGKGDISMILLVKLNSNSKIPPHIDEGLSNNICNRTHIPLVTNEKVIFNINGEERNLKEGEIWEIANQHTHSIRNESTIDRIHLLIDYLPNSKKIKDTII